MLTNVTDIRANLNENILHAVTIIGKSPQRRRVFEAIYKGKKEIKTVKELTNITGLSDVRVLQEAGKLHANHIVEKTKFDKQTAYKKYEFYTHHKTKILSIIDNPHKRTKYPTKQSPALNTTVYKFILPGKKPKVIPITIDDVDSFSKVRKITTIDNSLRLDKTSEEIIKHGLQNIIGESNPFKDWGGEKNDLYTNKLKYKCKRKASAFAIKGKATKGTLTPKKMGKNGDQISRLMSCTADIFWIVYHSKIDESIVSQLQAFALAKSMSGQTVYYAVIDGDDLNRLYQAYKSFFK